LNFYVLIYGPPALGALIALVVAIVRGRFTLFRPGLSSAFGIAAAFVVIALSLGAVGLAPMIDLNSLFLDGVMALTLTPLLLGVVGCGIIVLTPSRAPSGVAEVKHRSSLNVGPRGWFVTIALTLLLILVATVWAGWLSSADEQGRFRYFEVQPSASFSAGGGIYGWYYSKWAALVIFALLLLGVLRLWRIKVGPGTDASRAAHNRVILAMIAGALLLHLAEIVFSLSGAGAIQGGATLEGEFYTFQSSLAALTSPLRWAGNVLQILGWGAWFTVLFSPGPTNAVHQASPSIVSGGK